MAEKHMEEHTTGGEALTRREFMARVALLAAGAAAAPLLAACDTGQPTAPTPTTASTLGNTPAALSTATPAVVATETPAPAAPADTAPPPATATQSPADTAVPTATRQPEPTQTTPPTPTATRAAAPKSTPTGTATNSSVPGPHGVALLASTDRTSAVPAVLDLLGFAPGWLRGKRVALKANFNSADPAPGSTHLDTLTALLQRLQDWGAASITLVERSGMGDTRQVLRQRGVMDLASKFGVKVVVLDDLGAGGWVKLQGAHWQRGFLFPRQVQEADAVVQTCCLKTHRFGGHFTLSLKNSVGLVAKYDPKDGYNYMSELHGSAGQRLMIAEINTAYKPDLVLLDGVRAFLNGGPDTGKDVEAGLFLASRDRVALDAVGVAMLRHLGTTAEVSRGSIFEQPQIARAAALGLGASSAAAITLHPAPDDPSRALAEVLEKQLAA